MAKTVKGYSGLQIGLHWAVVVLILFQFFGHDGMEATWRAFLRNEPPAADVLALTYMHVGAGLLVLLFALARIYLRITRGAPRPNPDEPLFYRLLADGVHGLLYLLLLLVPLSGSVAWFLGVPNAGEGHELLKNVLFFVVIVHVAGALFQHFVRKSNVLTRMVIAEDA